MFILNITLKSMANLKPTRDDPNQNKISETDLNKSYDTLDHYIEKDLKEKHLFQERCKSVFSINTSCKEEARKDQVYKFLYAVISPKLDDSRFLRTIFST